MHHTNGRLPGGARIDEDAVFNAHVAGDAYVAGWVTGWRAYSKRVLHAFCEPGERIAGFIFIGHANSDLVDRERPALSNVSHAWTPPSR